MLEATVKTLFDYQRFERNALLQDVIDEALAKYAPLQSRALPDEDLALAAGGVGEIPEPVREPEHDGHGTV